MKTFPPFNHADLVCRYNRRDFSSLQRASDKIHLFPRILLYKFNRTFFRRPFILILGGNSDKIQRKQNLLRCLWPTILVLFSTVLELTVLQFHHCRLQVTRKLAQLCDEFENVRLCVLQQGRQAIVSKRVCYKQPKALYIMIGHTA